MSSPDAQILEVLKSFVAEHPEIMPELSKAAEAAVEKVPLTIFDLFHELVGHVKNIDAERAEQLHAAVDQHQAQHEALLAAVPSAANPEPASSPPAAEVTPPSSPAPAVAVSPLPSDPA